MDLKIPNDKTYMRTYLDSPQGVIYYILKELIRQDNYNHPEWLNETVNKLRSMVTEEVTSVKLMDVIKILRSIYGKNAFAKASVKYPSIDDELLGITTGKYDDIFSSNDALVTAALILLEI